MGSRLHATRGAHTAASVLPARVTTTKKNLTETFGKGTQRWVGISTYRLISGINQGDHFLLTESVTINRLVKLIYRGG